MKRLAFLSLAAVFLATGCKNLMSSSSGLPPQSEPDLADYESELDEPPTLLGSLKSKISGTADSLKSGVDRVAETATNSADSLRQTTLSEFGEQYEPEVSDE